MKVSDDKLMEMFERIYDKLETQDNKLDSIHIQTTKTNGRVAENVKEIERLKRKSLGLWVTNNPVKFIMFVISTISVLISNSRDAIINIIKGLF